MSIFEQKHAEFDDFCQSVDKMCDALEKFRNSVDKLESVLTRQHEIGQRQESEDTFAIGDTVRLSDWSTERNPDYRSRVGLVVEVIERRAYTTVYVKWDNDKVSGYDPSFLRLLKRGTDEPTRT